MLVSLLVTILLGMLVGWVASLIMKRDAEQGAVENILVGIGGALLGGFVASMFDQGRGVTPFLTFDAMDIFWALLGAIALCAILNYFKRGRVR